MMADEYDARRVQVLIAFGYGGEPFYGLAPQPGLATAGGALKSRVASTGMHFKALNFCARTDRGVFAQRNVATGWLDLGPGAGADDVRPAFERFAAGITQDPQDGLMDVRAYRVPMDTHARNIGEGKHYRYVIADGLGGIVDVRGRRRSWAISPQLDVATMQKASAYLVGRHDFSAFQAKRDRRREQDPVREVTAVHVQRCNGHIIIDVHGRSFLRHMVRKMVGGLAMVGAGWLRPSEVAPAWQNQNPSRRGPGPLAPDFLGTNAGRHGPGPLAPAQGLTLVDISLREIMDLKTGEPLVLAPVAPYAPAPRD